MRFMGLCSELGLTYLSTTAISDGSQEASKNVLIRMPSIPCAQTVQPLSYRNQHNKLVYFPPSYRPNDYSASSSNILTL
jgi:hypothetical protein